jgi:hypothetical protein
MEGLRPVHWLASLLAVLIFCHGEFNCTLSRSCSFLIGMSLATNLDLNSKAGWLQRAQNFLCDYVDALFLVGDRVFVFCLLSHLIKVRRGCCC